MDERLREIRVSREAIKIAMNDKGVRSVRALSKLAGIATTTCYVAITQRTASWYTLEHIATALGVEPQELAEDDVSEYGKNTIPELDEEGAYKLVEAVVRQTVNDYKVAYRLVLKGKDPYGVAADEMRDCMRALREFIPERADAAEEFMRREVESERRKKVFGRDPDATSPR